MKQLSSIETVAPFGSEAKLLPPESDGTFFYTAGRMLSYNIPNKNGLVFFKDDCEKVLSTLKTSLANIAHIKPGNNVKNPYGLTHAVCGAIAEYHSDDDGIDIIVKNDRAVVKNLGFDESDFRPGGSKFSTYSQESDFSPETSPWITVPVGKTDRITKEDIIDTYSYEDGLKAGLKSSYYDAATGRWKYAYDPKGNVVFVQLNPTAFAGVGHVVRPADETAQIYSYAASIEGEKVISSLYPRIDQTERAASDPGETLDPNTNKELSSHMEAKDLTPQLNEEIKTLTERTKTLSSEKDSAESRLTELEKSFSEYKTAQATLVEELKGQLAAKDTTIAERDAVIKDANDKALSATRLATLEAIHPFSEEEKTEDFVKSLSTISDDRFETFVVRRELAKVQANSANRSLSSLMSDVRLDSVPRFDGTQNSAGDTLKITSPLDIF